MGQRKAKFKINGKYDSPELLDYDILGYHKKRTIISGELRTVEYYKYFDGINYSDLVVKESRTYIRDSIDIVQSRILNVDWYLEDNTIGCTKSNIKYYSPEEAIQEGIDRRTNMISFAKTVLLAELARKVGVPRNQEYSFDLLLNVKTQMEYFVQGYTQSLRDAIANSTKPYLTADMKAKIINELTF